MIAKANKTKNWFFEKINKMNNAAFRTTVEPTNSHIRLSK